MTFYLGALQYRYTSIHEFPFLTACLYLVAHHVGNGTYTRDLATASGPIEDLEVPRDHEGRFHTQVFDRSSHYEPQVAEGITQMFVAGVSTQKVGDVTQTLMGVAPSASAVSRLNQTLTEQFEAWRERPLLTHYRIVSLDGVHFTIRHGEQTDSTIIVTALGVGLEGNKDVLALRACAEEDKDGWRCLLQDVRRRGATQVDLIVTDGHEGLLAAVSALFTATARQRCVVHTQRTVSMPFPIASAKRSARNWLASSNWKRKRMRCSMWRPFKANIRSAIPKPSVACVKMKNIC